MSLGPGNIIGPFEIQSLIGKGGMGHLSAAVDTRLDRHAALKLLPQDFRSDPQRLQRFQAETKTLASLKRPDILSVFGMTTGENCLTTAQSSQASLWRFPSDN